MPAGLDGNPDPVRSPQRDDVLRAVAQRVLAAGGGRLRVGIDGRSGAGKSTFADELGRVLETAGRPVVRSTTDSFHNPYAVRHGGQDPAAGYVEKSHDLDAIRTRLLEPFTAGRTFVIETYDQPSESPVSAEPRTSTPDTVLVFDGLFLHRAELRDSWDLSVVLLAEGRYAAALDAARKRLGPDRYEAFVARYVRGWEHYEHTARPGARAGLVIDNDDLLAPVIVRS